MPTINGTGRLNSRNTGTKGVHITKMLKKRIIKER